MPQRFPFTPPFALEEFQTTAMGRSLLAGRLIATAISNIDGRHITVRLSAKRPPQGSERRWQSCDLAQATRCFVDVPGRDLAAGDKVGTFDVHDSVFWASNDDTRRVNAARYVLLCAAGRLDGSKVEQSVSCFYCGRPLTDPVSIRRGIGPVCYGKVTGSEHERKGVDDFPAQTLGGASAAHAAAIAESIEAEERRLAHKADFAARERAQEEAAFASDPDFIALAPGQDPRTLLTKED